MRANVFFISPGGEMWWYDGQFMHHVCAILVEKNNYDNNGRELFTSFLADFKITYKEFTLKQ